MDADGDGLNLGEELELGTDPVADSDGDGLSDGDEIALGTDPGETDTDSDGLNDKRETVLGTNPLLWIPTAMVSMTEQRFRLTKQIL